MALQIDLLPQVKKYRDAWTVYENWEMSTERSGESAALIPAIKYLGGEAALEFARGLDPGDADEGWRRKEYLKLRQGVVYDCRELSRRVSAPRASEAGRSAAGRRRRVR